MQIADQSDGAPHHVRRIEFSKHLCFDIDRDVIRGRELDSSLKLLPDGLSRVDTIDFLTETERRLLSRIQGRTYANMLATLEHFIGAKMTEVNRDRRPGDPIPEALMHLTEEEIKHQELFRRLDHMIGSCMPEGYVLATDPTVFTGAMVARSTWAALALVCHIEVSVLAHYRASIDGDPDVAGVYRDVFLHHAREESQHAMLDTLQWAREHAKLSDVERDRAVDDLIELVWAIDGILQSQASADTEYFLHVVPRTFDTDQVLAVRDTLLAAYRWQYILSGAQEPRFAEALGAKINLEQADRIQAVLGALLNTNN